MRFESTDWSDAGSVTEQPQLGKTFLLMCETRGAPKPLPVIRWFFNGREVGPGSRLFYIIVSVEQTSVVISNTNDLYPVLVVLLIKK